MNNKRFGFSSTRSFFKSFTEKNTIALLILLIMICGLTNLYISEKFKFAGVQFQYNDASHLFEFTELEQSVRSEINLLKGKFPIRDYRPDYERKINLGDALTMPRRVEIIDHFDTLFLYAEEILLKLQDLDNYSFKHFQNTLKVLERSKLIIEDTPHVADVVSEDDLKMVNDIFIDLVKTAHKLNDAVDAHEKLTKDWQSLKSLMRNPDNTIEENAKMLMQLVDLLSALQNDHKSIIRLSSDNVIHAEQLAKPFKNSNDMFAIIYDNHNKLSKEYEKVRTTLTILVNLLLILCICIKDTFLNFLTPAKRQ